MSNIPAQPDSTANKETTPNTPVPKNKFQLLNNPELDQVIYNISGDIYKTGVQILTVFAGVAILWGVIKLSGWAKIAVAQTLHDAVNTTPLTDTADNESGDRAPSFFNGFANSLSRSVSSFYSSGSSRSDLTMSELDSTQNLVETAYPTVAPMLDTTEFGQEVFGQIIDSKLKTD